jgi:REP element-mobilizing transposase RayT
LLAFPAGWGGRRRGSGRKPKGERAGVPHKKKPALSPRHAVHVTMRLRAGLPSLRRWKEYDVLLGAFRTGCERFGFRLVHYAVMGNHLHLLTEGDDRHGHWRGVQGLAIRIAKRLNKLWKRKGKVFHERFHGRDLKTPREVRAVLEYLMHNARRHGYRVAAEGPDPYSSGRWFDGWRGWGANTLWSAPLARARAWIVTHGWRRLGLIEVRWRSP